MHFVWGLETSPPGLDLDFDFSSAGVQEFLLDSCRLVQAQDFAGEVSCVMQDFHTWCLRQAGCAWPIPAAHATATFAEFLDADYTECNTDECQKTLGTWSMFDTLNSAEPDFSNRAFWKGHFLLNDDRVSFISVRVSLSHAPPGIKALGSINLKHAADDFKKIEEWTQNQNKAAPAGANHAFQTNGMLWTAVHNNEMYYETALRGTALGGLLAFVVVMIATRSLVLSLISISSIALVISQVC